MSSSRTSGETSVHLVEIFVIRQFSVTNIVVTPHVCVPIDLQYFLPFDAQLKKVSRVMPGHVPFQIIFPLDRIHCSRFRF